MANTLTKMVRHTALWGGGLPRTTGLDGIWLGIPTGHLNANPQFGTSASPDTTYGILSTADDLCSVIWQALDNIHVRKCRIWHGQGYTSNTTHGCCLMRYDIDADGDLTNGVETGAATTNANSDDYSMLRYTTCPINAANATVTSDQVLIAMVNPLDNANAGMTAKCIIEYT